jgi:hypothetical protein
MEIVLVAVIAVGGVLTAVGIQNSIGWLIALGFLTMAYAVVSGLASAARQGAAETPSHAEHSPGEAHH